jgi:hypothetical protein
MNTPSAAQSRAEHIPARNALWKNSYAKSPPRSDMDGDRPRLRNVAALVIVMEDECEMLPVGLLQHLRRVEPWGYGGIMQLTVDHGQLVSLADHTGKIVADGHHRDAILRFQEAEEVVEMVLHAGIKAGCGLI